MSTAVTQTLRVAKVVFSVYDVATEDHWRGGRVVECTGLENRKAGNGLGSSNLPLSAMIHKDGWEPSE